MASHDVDLAMPIGLPPPTANASTHYQQLATRLSASVAPGSVIHAWVADDAAYDGVHAMGKGFLRFVPSGGTAPSGATVSAPMLVLKPWPWDYLALRRTAGPTAPLPKLIGYGDVDATGVGAAIDAELASNARYASLTGGDRTQARNDFLAGASRLVVNAGTKIGTAAVDPSPPSGSLAGYRRLDLSFLDSAGGALDPAPFIDLWGMVGGPLVTGHPLLSALARPVSPSVAPVEGGTRIRIGGAALTTGTSVTVGTQAATDVQVAANGTVAWATLPAHAAGTADVAVAAPGQAVVTHSDAVTYATDLAVAARGIVASLAVRLAEMKEFALALGSLTPQAKAEFGELLGLAHRLAVDQIEARAAAVGAPAAGPDTAAVWDDARPAVQAASAALEQLIA